MIFEKIRERLQEKKAGRLNLFCDGIDCAIDIINQVEAEYNNGWIPCGERLPQNAEWVLCYGKNRDGEFKYEVSNYVYEIHCWMCSRIADVIAWQSLPEPYIPKGE